MKKSKRIILVFLAISMVLLSFTSCESPKREGNENDTTETGDTTTFENPIQETY